MIFQGEKIPESTVPQARMDAQYGVGVPVVDLSPDEEDFGDSRKTGQVRFA